MGVVHEVGEEEHRARERDPRRLVAREERGHGREDDEAPAAEEEEVDPAVVDVTPPVGQDRFAPAGGKPLTPGPSPGGRGEKIGDAPAAGRCEMIRSVGVPGRRELDAHARVGHRQETFRRMRSCLAMSAKAASRLSGVPSLRKT